MQHIAIRDLKGIGNKQFQRHSYPVQCELGLLILISGTNNNNNINTSMTAYSTLLFHKPNQSCPSITELQELPVQEFTRGSNQPLPQRVPKAGPILNTRGTEMQIYKAKTTLKWFKMLPKPTTRCWRMVLEMQTVCKPKPWQQLLLQLKTLLAFCFHWCSQATTFFTGPIISIQINYRLQYRGKGLKRRQYWVETELKLKLSIISVLLR